MPDSIKSIPSKIINAFKNMDKGRRKRLIVLVSLMLIVIITVSVLLNQKTYTVLYSGMKSEDTSQVLSLLNEMGVDAKAQGEDTVLVAGNEVDTIRLELASQGYPSSGLNYDIYQNATGLGVTDSEKKVYYQYQLQENLRKTIMQMSKVEDAVVNIDLGEDSSYVLSDDNKAATASIMLTLKSGETLENSEVNAIAELISKSISGLDLDNVRIVDSQMNLYALGGDNEVQNADSQFALQNNVKAQLQQQIINLLSPVFGEKNVLAEVNVKLNFDKQVSESVEYSSPEGKTQGIVVSMKELIEAIGSNSAGGVAGLDANGNASQYLAQAGTGGDDAYYNISREVNYEINHTTKQIEEAQGQIEDLSVSVILNSKNIDNYEDEVKQLVSSATGAQVDKITVEMLPFAQADESVASEIKTSLTIQQQMMSQAQSEETVRTVIMAAAVLIVLIFIFSIVKLFRRNNEEIVVAESSGFEVIADEEIIPEPLSRGAGSKVGTERKQVDIDFEKNKDDNLSVLKDYVNTNPESVANMLRNWLNEE